MTHFMFKNEIISKILTLIIISLLILVYLPQNSILDDNKSFSSELLDNSKQEGFENYENDYLKNRPFSFAYTPIDNLTGTGDNLVVTDELAVSHSVSLSLTSGNGYSDSYTISGISGFTNQNLEYDLSISSRRDDYIILESSIDNKNADLDSNQVRVAQGFEVYWDYAVFYGADIYLDATGSTLGNDQLELFVVKADGLGQPNMSDIRAIDLNGPYNSSNTIPASSTGNYAYYDFTNISLSGNAILENGNYFIVANLSSYDVSADNFFWVGEQGGSETYPNYLHDGTSWRLLKDETRDLIVDLKPSYSNGTSLVFTDPTDVSLQDNAQAVTSLTQQITSTGLHTITSDTSIDISMNNSYLFSNVLSCIATYYADNSTYPNYDISWEIIWNIPQVDLLSYSNPVRNHYILAPSDWSNTVFSLSLNDIPITVLRNLAGYECDIQILYSGSEYLEGDFKLQTSSPNYVTNTEISDGVQATNEFTLGYWTTDTIDAFGHEGSSVFVEVGINDILQSGGILNFTLFNSDGNIIPWKNSSLLPANLNYIDTSYYSGLGYFDPGENVFKHNISIDPSISESDKEGQWTAFVLWQNGTEVGLFSSSIVIGKPTLAEFAWEDTLGQNDMTNDTMIELTRINGHGIHIEVDYYNISDPFFSGIGTPITHAIVNYTASWGDSGSLPFVDTQYVLDIITDAPTGVYTINLIASGPFLETQSIQISVRIVHQFEISPVRNSYAVNYTNEVTAIFELRDISFGNVLVEPDSIVLKFNGSTLSVADYTYSFDNQRIKITIDTGDILGLSLTPDSYTLLVSAIKTDFVSDYGIDTAVDSTTIVVTTIHTHIAIEETVTETDSNSQISVTFRFVDLNHSVDIEGASVDVRFDIDEIELVSWNENNGLYTLLIRINEPSIATLNVFIDIYKTGYQSQMNFLLSSVSINLPTNGGGIPLGVLIGIIAGIAVVILATVGYFVFRRRMRATKDVRLKSRSRARAIFQSTMMIKKVIVVHHETSLPIFEKDVDKNAIVDPSIITGVLQAISSIGTEMIGAPTGVKKIEYYGFVVTSAYSGAYTVYVFSETEIEPEFETGVDNIARWFDLIFGYDSAQWDGSMDIYNEYRISIEEKISEELFLWMLFPIHVPDKEMDLNILNQVEKEILEAITQNANMTVIKLVDQLDKYDSEEVIYHLFNLVDSEHIITSYTD